MADRIASGLSPQIEPEYDWRTLLRLRVPHLKQTAFLDSPAKRKVIRAGRRGGKTVGIAILALRYFMRGARVLYGAPTQEQIETFWFEITTACYEAVSRHYLYKNETEHVIEVPGTKNRIRAKTAWNAETLRGDYGDLLILDEFQLMNEDTWGIVGAPMLLDNNGDAVFIYTPPSLHAKHSTKARDVQHAAKLFQKAETDTRGRWAAFHFTSHDNPHISAEALEEITFDMSSAAIRQEIEAQDTTEAPGALWNRALLDTTRKTSFPELVRVVVGVDPPGKEKTECGIIIGGLGQDGHAYVLDDYSIAGTPNTWAKNVIAAYHRQRADRVVGEDNYGGDMVENTIRSALEDGQSVSYKPVHATRGKEVRAEPIVALYERGIIHHVGTFTPLEDELCTWVPGRGMLSPNRLDALVWVMTDLMLKGGSTPHIQRL